MQQKPILTEGKMKRIILVLLLIVTLTIPGYNRDKFVLGTEENDGQLYVPFQVDEGPDGNIYVFDAKDAFIKIFSQEGGYLRRMGGRGQGPGEIVRLGTFGFSNNNLLFFTEMINGHRWITFMELSGKVNKIIKLVISGQFGIYRAKMLKGNQIIAEIHLWGLPEKRGNHYGYYYNRRLAAINPGGKIDRILIKKDYIFSVSQGPGRPDVRIPFFPEFLWDIDKDENIIFSEGNDNILQIYDLKGNVAAQNRTSLPDAPEVKTEDLKKWRDSIKKEIVRRRGINQYKTHFSMIEKYEKSIYPQKPILGGLSITPAGNMLVKGNIKEGTDKRRYWLIDKKGTILTDISTTARFITISANFILYIMENENGEQAVYCYRRQGKEKNDLLVAKIML
jgi:hypothetical protein